METFEPPKAGSDAAEAKNVAESNNLSINTQESLSILNSYTQKAMEEGNRWLNSVGLGNLTITDSTGANAHNRNSSNPEVTSRHATIGSGTNGGGGEPGDTCGSTSKSAESESTSKASNVKVIYTPDGTVKDRVVKDTPSASGNGHFGAQDNSNHDGKIELTNPDGSQVVADTKV